MDIAENVHARFDNLKDALRDDRIKYGTDYTIIEKYGCTNIMCIEVYRDRIEEIADKHGVQVKAWHYFDPDEDPGFNKVTGDHSDFYHGER